MADQNITALPVSDTPVSSDQLLLVGATEEKLIDYDKLADAILNKLTSKNFSLDQGTMPLIRALNELNSNRAFGTLITSEDHDCNNLGFGIFLLLNPKNGVTEINWHVVISANNNGAQTGFQITYDLTDGSKAYTRTQASGTWSNWTSIK